MSDDNRSFTQLPAKCVAQACRRCLTVIKERREEKDNRALDAEIARRAKGWLFGLFREAWTRDDARKYFESFSGLDVYLNPLLHYSSNQETTATQLLKLSEGALLSGGTCTVNVTAEDFSCISDFYAGEQRRA